MVGLALAVICIPLTPAERGTISAVDDYIHEGPKIWRGQANDARRAGKEWAASKADGFTDAGKAGKSWGASKAGRFFGTPNKRTKTVIGEPTTTITVIDIGTDTPTSEYTGWRGRKAKVPKGRRSEGTQKSINKIVIVEETIKILQPLRDELEVDVTGRTTPTRIFGSWFGAGTTTSKEKALKEKARANRREERAAASASRSARPAKGVEEGTAKAEEHVNAGKSVLKEAKGWYFSDIPWKRTSSSKETTDTTSKSAEVTTRSTFGKGKPTSLDTKFYTFPKNQNDIFARMINVAMSLHQTIDYEPVTELASKLRLAREIFYRGEISFQRSNATLAGYNLQLKEAFCDIHNVLRDMQFLPKIHGNSLVSQVPTKVLAELKKFEKLLKSGKADNEAVKVLWDRYKRELEEYYRHAADWVPKLARAHQGTSRVSQYVAAAKTLIHANFEAESKFHKDLKAWFPEANARKQAQLDFLSGIETQARLADHALMTAGEKIKEVLSKRAEDVKRFGGKFKDYEVKLEEQVDLLGLLKQETEKRWKEAEAAFVAIGKSAIKRFKVGEHAEL